MAQYPDNAEFFLPGGQIIKGRQQIGDLFQNARKPLKQGGTCRCDGTRHVLEEGVGPPE